MMEDSSMTKIPLHCGRRRSIILALLPIQRTTRPTTTLSVTGTEILNGGDDGSNVQQPASSSNRNRVCTLCHYPSTTTTRKVEDVLCPTLKTLMGLSHSSEWWFCPFCSSHLQTLTSLKVEMEGLGEELCKMVMNLCPFLLVSKNVHHYDVVRRRQQIQVSLWGVWSGYGLTEEDKSPTSSSPCSLCKGALKKSGLQEDLGEPVSALLVQVGLRMITEESLQFCDFCSNQLQSSVLTLKERLDGMGERLAAMVMGLKDLLPEKEDAVEHFDGSPSSHNEELEEEKPVIVMDEVDLSSEDGMMTVEDEEEEVSSDLHYVVEPTRVDKKTPRSASRPDGILSYRCLIALALKNSKTGSLPVGHIYNFICDHFPYFRTTSIRWKNAVRHCLTAYKNTMFLMTDREDDGKVGCLWSIVPGEMARMDDIILQQMTIKDPELVKRTMSDPENLELLKSGGLCRDYSGTDCPPGSSSSSSSPVATVEPLMVEMIPVVTHVPQPPRPGGSEGADKYATSTFFLPIILRGGQPAM